MAELFASIEGGAVVERLPSRQSVATQRRSSRTARDEDPGVKPGRAREGIINKQIKKARDLAVILLPLDKTLNSSTLEREKTSRQLDEVTLAAAKSAKDYRSWMLEHLKVNINAAPQDANGLASTTVPPDFGGQEAGRPRAKEKNSRTPGPKRQLPVAVDAVEEHRAKALELINANVNSALEYARRLASVKSPAEFIELSTNHACRHFKLIMTLRLHLARCGGF